MNFLAIIISVIFSMVLGYVWYSPAVFGNAWMKLVGITKKEIEDSKESMAFTYGGMFLVSLVQAVVLAQFIEMTTFEGRLAGLLVGFFAWLGFTSTYGLSTVLFSKKPLKLYAIEAGYQLVYLLVAGVIIGAWQ